MRTVFYPGAVTSGDNITIPTGDPDISSITSATIKRIRDSFSIADHDIDTQVAVGGAVTNDLGHDGSSPAQLETAAGANVTIEGAVSAHSESGTDPDVAATPTKVDARNFTLNVDTEDGDLVVLEYESIGEYPIAN